MTHTSPQQQQERQNDFCEWCGSEYPHGMMDFCRAVVFGKEHAICIDCFNHLEIPDIRAKIYNVAKRKEFERVTSAWKEWMMLHVPAPTYHKGLDEIESLRIKEQP